MVHAEPLVDDPGEEIRATDVDADDAFPRHLRHYRRPSHGRRSRPRARPLPPPARPVATSVATIAGRRARAGGAPRAQRAARPRAASALVAAAAPAPRPLEG